MEYVQSTLELIDTWVSIVKWYCVPMDIVPAIVLSDDLIASEIIMKTIKNNNDCAIDNNK